jgi:hypothetical protein
MARPEHADLAAMTVEELAAHLTAHSNLPGPRGNLELADAFSATASREAILEFAEVEDEYLRFCGTQGLGRLLAEVPGDAPLLAMLLERAADPLWRVREAVARALQILGRSEPAAMHGVVAAWVEHPDAYVRRAAVAAICEPALLRDGAGFRAGLGTCEAATASLVALSPADRKSPGPRNLRQGLGYGWSVVVAANPGEGMPAFDRLRESADPDVAWIVKSNLSKNRLKRLVEGAAGPRPS